MKRRSFLSLLGIGAVAIPMASVLGSVNEVAKITVNETVPPAVVDEWADMLSPTRVLSPDEAGCKIFEELRVRNANNTLKVLTDAAKLMKG